MIKISGLLDERFMPHGHCYFWEPFVLWSYAISDSIIAIAYFSIPLALLYIYLKRKDFTYVWVMVLFAIFIAGCGITHVFDVINIWKPLYNLDVIARIVTAIASIGTAAVLIKLTPKIIDIPTAAQWKNLNEELQSINEELQAQIEELKEKDKTIQAYREFEQLTATLPQLVFTTNAYMTRGKQVFMNERWFQYTGLTNDKDFDDIVAQCLTDEQRDIIVQNWQNSLQTHEPFEMEILLKRYDGLYRWHVAKAVYVADTKHWVGTFTDIHDQKLFAEELAEKNKQLMMINTDLDNFIYTASHDLKAPIANIEGLTLALVKKLNNKFLLDEEQNRILSMIAASAGRLKSTIADLTEIAKAQKESVEEEVVSVSSVVEEVCEDLDRLITDNHVLIHKSITVDEIKIAPKSIRSILFNLISNAIKYRSQEREVEVHIETKIQGNYMLIAVADNGVGIAEKHLEKMFTMFKRFHTHVEGTGIGLYIIKRIVENAGGKVEVESQVNVGTVFRIYLPCQR